jgi:hypothetical protein
MPLGDGWPSLVRAVDAPAVQDVPAWDGTCGLASSGETRKSLEVSTCRAFLTLIASGEEGCGYELPLGQLSLQPVNRRYASFRQRLLHCGLRPLDGSLHRRDRPESEGLGERP